MNDSISVFVVDDNRLLREGLVSMLGEREGIAVIGAAPGGDEALEQIEALRPDVALRNPTLITFPFYSLDSWGISAPDGKVIYLRFLIDIGMPGKDGIEVTQVLRQEAPEVKVIILGMVDLTDEIMACIGERGCRLFVCLGLLQKAHRRNVRVVPSGRHAGIWRL